MPFVIPESWVLSDFSELVTLLSGRDLESNDCNSNREGIPYLIGASNIVDGKINITRWTTRPLVISKRGDILISCKGTIGEVVTNVIGEIHIARQFMAIQTLPMVYADYIELYIKSIVNNIKRNARGVIPGISREDILQREIALPPLEEQKRIVIEVEKWLDFIADIEAEKNELESHIKKTKSKILDLAISGKLVPQDPNDEPAIELLRRINPGFKPCDNSHYENLPQGWTIVGLHSVAEIITGSTPSKLNAEYYNGDVPFYKPNDLDQGRHVRCASEYLSQQGKSISRSIPCNSIAVCCIGSIGKCGFIEKEGVTNQQINTIVPNDAIFPLYMYYFCNSSTFIDELQSLSSAVTISIVNKSKLSTIQIPLPPIAEQKRIISVIEKLYSHIDMITAEL